MVSVRAAGYLAKLIETTEYTNVTTNTPPKLQYNYVLSIAAWPPLWPVVAGLSRKSLS